MPIRVHRRCGPSRARFLTAKPNTATFTDPSRAPIENGRMGAGCKAPGSPRLSLHLGIRGRVPGFRIRPIAPFQLHLAGHLSNSPGSMLKKGATIAGSVVVIAFLVVGGLYLRGRFVARDTPAVTADLPSLSPDSATLARGNHLSHTMGCRHCHGQNLGGQVFADDPPFRLVAGNLTSGRGGVGDTYSAPEWARAIRHGIGPTGRPLLAMPSVSYHRLSDADTRALIAYLQQAPAVDRELPSTRIRPLGYILMGPDKSTPVATSWGTSSTRPTSPSERPSPTGATSTAPPASTVTARIWKAERIRIRTDRPYPGSRQIASGRTMHSLPQP